MIHGRILGYRASLGFSGVLGFLAFTGLDWLKITNAALMDCRFWMGLQLETSASQGNALQHMNSEPREEPGLQSWLLSADPNSYSINPLPKDCKARNQTPFDMQEQRETHQKKTFCQSKKSKKLLSQSKKLFPNQKKLSLPVYRQA